MHEYVQIGNEHLQEFYKQWERKFNQYEEESIDKIQEMRGSHDLQMEKLEEKLGRAVEAAKIKPTLKQTSEKLVAVNERVEEAQNYRKELKILEVHEAERVERMRQ
jgi:hypothetical protein